MAIVKQATKTINKYIKRIAKEVGIESGISTYTARHSFATALKRNGAPTSLISESLGHNNEKTTQSYLDSFDLENKRKYTSSLLDFSGTK